MTIAVVDADPRLTEAQIIGAQSALENAIAQINAVGSNIRLAPSRSRPDIQIFLTADRGVRKHRMLRDMENGHLTRSIGLARVFYENYRINEALIVVAVRKNQRELHSVMLEEVVQSLGLVNDIRNPYYRSRSIFSETSNETLELRDQDATALRLHYPPS